MCGEVISELYTNVIIMGLFKNSNLFFKAAFAALVVAVCFSCTKQAIEPEPTPQPKVDWGTTTIASVLEGKVGDTFEIKAVAGW